MAALENPAEYGAYVKATVVGTLALHANQSDEPMTVHQLHEVFGHPVLRELRELAGEGVIEQAGHGMYRLSARAEYALLKMNPREMARGNWARSGPARAGNADPK